MVYETDFYTTRRPYRATPSLSTYTISSEPSRQVRLLPGLGKVHVVHTYDRIVPYVGHKKLTVVSSPPVVVRVRPSTLYREYDRIENKLRPISYNSYTNDYLNSDSHVMFDDETRLIRAQTASLLQRIHNPVPRKTRPMPLPYVSRYEEVPARLSNDNYIHRMLISSPSSKSEYTTYYTDPVRKYFGQGRLACITLVGDKSHPRRRNVYMYQDPVRNDIQLLSYYITKFRDEKAALAKPIKVVLSPIRPSRIFSVPKPLEDTTSEELKAMKSERAARLAKITVLEDEPIKPKSAERAKKAGESEAKAKKEAEAQAKAEAAAKAKKEEEAKAKKEAEAKAKAEAEAKKAAEEAAAKKAADEAAAKKAAEEAAKEEAAKKEKEAKEAAERAAELERAAEQARQEELAKQAEIERVKQEEEEKARLEEEKRLADEAKAEEERQQLLRLEEIARQAEEEKEAELARQAEELAELARQEAELAEQAKKEEEEAEQERKAAEAADLEKKQAELEELSEVAKQETELAEQARIEADEAQKEAEIAEQQVNETAEEAPVEEPAEEEVALAEEDPTPAEVEEEEEEEEE